MADDLVAKRDGDVGAIIARRTVELAFVPPHPEHNGERCQELSPILLRVPLLPMSA